MFKTSLLLFSLLAGLAGPQPLSNGPVPPQQASLEVAPRQPQQTVRDALAPLANLIASGESTNAGGYDAANRGYGMDLGTDGLVKVFGTTHDNITIGQVMQAQNQGLIHAAGRYQIIRIAMRHILPYSGLTPDNLFNAENQDKLFETILRLKRPVVWAFLHGKATVNAAADALSREWAAVAYWDGLGYYSGGRAHVTRPEILSELEQTRQRIRTITPSA